MRFSNYFRYLILSICLPILVCHALLTLSNNFIKDKFCDQFEHWKEYLTFLDTNHVADLECARMCAHHKYCQYFRILSYKNGSKQCEIFSINGEVADLIGQDKFQSIQHSAALPEKGHTMSCFKHSHATSPSFSIATNVQSQSRMAFIDSTKPETQKKRYMSDNRPPFMESTAVFMDASGVYHAMVINCLAFYNSVYRGAMVYGMETSLEGFAPNAAREIHSIIYTGTLFKSSLWPNGSFEAKEFTVPNFRIYTPKVSEYTLSTVKGETNVSTLISWLRQGYKAYGYKYMIIVPEESYVAFHSVNLKVQIDTTGQPHSPLAFRQQIEVFPGTHRRVHNTWGSPNNFSNVHVVSGQDIGLSPLWTSAFDPNQEFNHRKAIIQNQILKGHRFRLSYKDIFFDVDQVIDHGNEIYFLLPQQLVNNSPKRLKPPTTGRRAVASFMGKYLWCWHYLEGDNAWDYGIELDQTLQFFVDTKEWIPLFSVDSNGNVASGNVADLAEAAVEGKDLNVLIQWRTNGRLKLMPITMTSVDGYGTSEVLVTAESVVSWKLIENLDGEMEFNPSCDMEKVLVKSSGEVQVLVYSSRKREPVDHLTDLQIIWFAF